VKKKILRRRMREFAFSADVEHRVTGIDRRIYVVLGLVYSQLARIQQSICVADRRWPTETVCFDLRDFNAPHNSRLWRKACETVVSNQNLTC
jgi:hypothetical protein